MLSTSFSLPAGFDFEGTTLLVGIGQGDPTTRRAPGRLSKAVWLRGELTALDLERRDATTVVARAEGGQAELLLREAPAILGLHDDPTALVPRHELIATLARRHAGLRLRRLPWIADCVYHAVLQQKVAFRDAAESHRWLVRRHGVDAPFGLRALPPWEALAKLSADDFFGVQIERQRSDTVRMVASVARRLDALADDPALPEKLRSIRGVGPWTVGTVMGHGRGDPDALLLGDYHLPNTVAFALAGEPRGDDARMLELLEPYVGQRFRVLRLLMAGGVGAPRYGPRMRPQWGRR
ncbi:MAG: hypothetical protein JNL79_21070 [Myxococcales bacterium]|nr:hypothetical protein [Myxococcales bacterium]